MKEIVKWLGALGLGAISVVGQAQLIGSSGRLLLGTEEATCIEQKCKFPVKVTVTDPVAGTCDASFMLAKITIPKGQHNTKLVWEIVKESGDSGKYEFTDSGISIHPGDANDPKLDLAEGGHDSTGKDKFKWISKNKRKAAKTLHYDIYIRRTAPGGKPVAICEAKDPVVVNSGN